MDAKVFLRELKRMCNNSACSTCAFMGGNCTCPEINYSTDNAVDAVERWSKAHPIVTNRDKFKEIFGITLDESSTYDGRLHQHGKCISMSEWLKKEYIQGGK